MQTNRPYLSIVSPVYQAAGLVEELVSRIVDSLSTLSRPYEIILVEDGSRDCSWAEIVKVCRNNPQVKGIKLSRNFGQHSAITAGLSESSGELVVVMDCDLQEDPACIPALIALCGDGEEGFDVVLTRRESPQQSRWRQFGGKLFFSIYSLLTDDSIHRHGVGTLSVLKRKVVDQFLELHDAHRHYLLLVRWLGFRSTMVAVPHSLRPTGKSSYSFKKLVMHAVDGIVSQSTRALHLSIVAGVTMGLLACAGVVFLFVAYFIWGFREGWASLAVLILLCSGLILLAQGVTSLYVGKSFEQGKQRPLFIISEKRN